jgi:Domain of unknown function (DUF1992)
MTERKPAGKSWETWIEELIHNAREAGEFDDLEGAGKPIPGITDPYDPDWWVKKFLQREKLTVLPPALELLRKVESGLAALWSLRSEADVRARVAALNAEIAKVNSRAAEGPPTRLASLDVDEILSEWRARRSRSG